MPPQYPIPPYTSESEAIILADIRQGQIPTSVFPSNVMQAHLPYIEKKNVINTYKIFELK